jgi:virginiamycin B lyase
MLGMNRSSLARRAALAAAALALLPATASAEPKLDGEFAVSSQPQYLTTGPDGNVWVALQDRVAKVAPDGTVTEYDPQKVTFPKGIATGPDGNLWVTQSNGVARFSPADPLAAESFQVAAIGDPRSIVTGADGNLWTASGDQVVKIPPGNPTGFTAYPVTGMSARGIASGGDGSLWVADFGGQRVLSVTTAGVATPYGAGGGVQEVAAGPGTQVAYANPGASPHHVGRVVPGGTPQKTDVGTTDPFGIAFGPDGAYWFAEFGTSSIGRLTVDGQVTRLTGLEQGSGPRYLTAGPANTLWVSLQTSNEILRITGVEAPPQATTPLPADTVAPTISRLSASARRVRFTLSEGATVRIQVRRLAHGKRRLVRSVPARPMAAGAGRVRLRKLRPGRYVLRLSAKDAAGNATSARLRFRVKR